MALFIKQQDNKNVDSVNSVKDNLTAHQQKALKLIMQSPTEEVLTENNLKSKILVALLRDDSVATSLTWRGHNLHSKSY